MANTKITSNVISDDIALGGNPTTTTQSAGNDTTRIATTAFVKAAIDATIDSAPGALDTLNELAAAIGDDANFSTTITNSIATKLPLAGGTLTGDLQAPGIYVGSTNTSFDFYNNGTSYLNGAVTVDDNLTVNGGVTVNSGHINLDVGLSLQWGDSHERIEQSDGHLEFFVNNGEAMTLDTNGLGIGTDAPSTRLEVRGGTGSGTNTHAVFTGTAGRGLAIQTEESGGQHNAQVVLNAQDTESNANPNIYLKLAGANYSRVQGTGIEIYQDIFSDSGSNRGAGYFRFLTDGASAEQSVAQIYMEQGSGDGGSRKCNMYLQVADNGAPTTALTIENNKYISTATYLNVATTNTASNAKLNVAGGIRFTHSPASAAGLNVVGQYSFNNSNTSNACGSVYYKMFILNFYHNNGHSQALFLANGGGGVGYRFTSINAGDATIRNGIQDFNLTTIGSAPNTFRIQISNGGGALTVSRTSGSNSFQVSVQALTGG